MPPPARVQTKLFAHRETAKKGIKHRASSIALLRTLLVAVFVLISSCYSPALLSLIRLRPHCKLFRSSLFPFALRNSRHFGGVIYSSYFLKVCPIHLHFPIIIVIVTSSFPVLSYNSAFLMTWFWPKDAADMAEFLIPNVCTLESRALNWLSARFPTRIEVMRERALAFQTALRHANTHCAFLIRAVISSSVPRSVTHTGARVSEVVCLLHWIWCSFPAVEWEGCHIKPGFLFLLSFHLSNPCRCTLECHPSSHVCVDVCDLGDTSESWRTPGFLAFVLGSTI